jgi:hypothetical protein
MLPGESAPPHSSGFAQSAFIILHLIDSRAQQIAHMQSFGAGFSVLPDFPLGGEFRFAMH